MPMTSAGLAGLVEVKFVAGLGGMAAEDEVVGAAELGADAVEGVVHGALVVRRGEVGEGLVAEGRECGGVHRVSLFGLDTNFVCWSGD